MYARTLLHKSLGKRCHDIHATRLDTCWLTVQSLIEGAQATVTSVGRGMSGNAYDKHKIKRVDRLLSNSFLHQELPVIYSALTGKLLKNMAEPIILIDWSPLCADQGWQLLRAAIPVGGRSLTLYEEVHPRKKLGNRKTQHEFLNELATLVPPCCKPVVVADSGFKTPFYSYVEKKLGWHWIGRIRSRDFIAFNDDPTQWFGAKGLYNQATTQAKDLGQIDWVRSNPLPSRLILIRQPKKRRQDLTYTGTQRQSKRSHSHASREREPWLLVCSLSLKDRAAKKLTGIYRRRMQIEEGFRDCKAVRYGLGMSQRSRMNAKRRAVLCLLASLAQFVLWCVGTAGQNTEYARRLRVNSSSKRPAYSSIFMGRLLAAQKHFRLPDKELLSVLDRIQFNPEAVS
jgi:hypothetical protein